MATIKNPLTIVKITGGGESSGGEAIITGYDTATGIISGSGFGSTSGTVYMLDRGTHTYIAQPSSSWSSTSITLTTPIDISTLEGDTSIVVVTNDGNWSTKWLVAGQVAVTGYAKIYVKDSATGVVRTVSMTDSSEWSQFSVANNAWSKQLVVNSNTFYSDEVVGIQFGTSFNATSFGNRTFGYFVNLDQPLTVPSSITSIGANFLGYCYGFNQPLVLSPNLTSVGSGFLKSCYDFNQPLTIPSSMTSIGDNFLDSCYDFNQPIALSSNLSSIGIRFLYYCRSFNHTLDLPSNLTTLGDNFLSYCGSFNQPITGGSGLTTIGIGFLSYCDSFNQPLTIPSGVTTISTDFLSHCYSFNQTLTLPSGLTTIADNFLTNCSSFNQPLSLPSNLNSIGHDFLSYCSAFNRLLTIPTGVTSISTNFLYHCYGFSTIIVNTTASPTDNNSLATDYNTAKMYVQGVTVSGTGTASWLANLPNRTSNPYRKLIDGTA